MVVMTSFKAMGPEISNEFETSGARLNQRNFARSLVARGTVFYEALCTIRAATSIMCREIQVSS